MLEKPSLAEGEIIDTLETIYGLQVTHLAFLPLGADMNSALYQATVAGGATYSIKLRSGEFNPLALMTPKLLYEQGCRQVIAPIEGRSQQLWTNLRHHTLSLFPFVNGVDGYERPLSAAEWREVGSALKQLHTTTVPAEWAAHLPRERYSPRWREAVVRFQAMAATMTFPDAMAARLATLLKEKQPQIDELVTGATRLAAILQDQQEISEA